MEPVLFFDSHYTSHGNDINIITHKSEFVNTKLMKCICHH